jgi:tetratricopeptide (TPR) repeat protein
MIVALFGATSPVWAQPIPGDRPIERTMAVTQAERIAREARALYGLGVVFQRQDRLIDAIRSLDEAVRLDPDAIPPRRSLLAIHRALGRNDEAIAVGQRIVERDPGDFETWEALAEILHDEKRHQEAINAMAHATRCEKAKGDPRHLLLMLNRLLGWAEESRDFATAESTGRNLAALLERERLEFQKYGFLTADEIHREIAETQERIGSACVGLKRLDAALEMFTAAQERYNGKGGPADPKRSNRILGHLGEVYHALGRYDAALNYLNKHLSDPAAPINSHRLRADTLRQLGRGTEVVPLLEAAARRHPKNIPFQLLLAEEHENVGNLWAAESIYKRLLADAASPNLDVCRRLFRLYSSERNHDRALTMLNAEIAIIEDKQKPEATRVAAAARGKAIVAALRAHPPLIRAMLPDAIRALRQEDPDRMKLARRTYYILANLALHAGDLDAAETLFRDSLRRIPVFLAIYVHDGLFDVLMKKKKFMEIVAVSTERIENQDTNVAVYRHFRALALARLNRLDDALADLDQAVQDATDPGKLSIRTEKVSMLTRAGRLDEALADAQKMQKEFPRAADAKAVRHQLASVHAARREYDKSEAILRAILIDDPDDASAHNALGYQWADQGRNLDEAEQLIRRAIELDKIQKREVVSTTEQSAAFLDSLGWVLFRKGKLDEARHWLEQATALDNGREDPSIWDHLGDVYFRLADKAKARAAWDQAARWYDDEPRGLADERRAELKRKRALLAAPE